MGSNRQMTADISDGRNDLQRKSLREAEDQLSIESIFVSFVFFVVLSQFLVYGESETFTQPFRPLIVLILTMQVVRRGRLRLPVCTTALAMSVYQMIVWFFLYPAGGTIREYLVLIFYFMMLFSVAGFPWNARELRLILFASFIAIFCCAVAFFFSNNMLDFRDHEMHFMGQAVNRNKNAYAFAFGIVLGRCYLAYGKGRNRILVLLIMLFEGYCLVYSKCRGAFLGAVICVFSVAVHRILRMRKKGSPYIVLYILTIIAICAIGYFLVENSQVSRLVDSENFSGRDDGMEHAVELFFRAPIWGKIFGNGMMYERNNTEGLGVHFVYLTYLLESGIIGATMVAVIFLQAMRLIRGEIQWSLFLLAFSRTFFEGMDYYIFIPLILSVCISNYERLSGRPCYELFYRRKYIT